MSLPLNGTNQYLSIADNDLLSFADDDYALSLWLKLASNAGSLSQYFLSWGLTSQYPSWNLYLFHEDYSPGGNQLRFYSKDASGTSFGFFSSTTPGTSRIWQHVLIQRTKSVDVIQMFVNGTEVASGTPTSYDVVNRSDGMIVGDYTGGSRMFTGKIAEVAKFHQAFDVTDRAALAGGASPGDYDPVWWRKLLANSTDGVGNLTITEYGTPSYDTADHPVSYGVAAMALENQFVAPFMRSQFVR